MNKSIGTIEFKSIDKGIEVKFTIYKTVISSVDSLIIKNLIK
ncbi:hypothetical protein [Clostridioides sp. ZZV14-6105]